MAVMTASQQQSGLNIRYLKGIGSKRAAVFEKIGIRSIRDLFYYFPRRYEDRSKFKPIFHLTPGESITIKGEVLSAALRRIRSLVMLEVVVGDETGMIPAVWFNQAYLKGRFLTGKEVILHGKVDFYQNRLQMSSPEYETVDESASSIHTGRITPIYPLTEGLYQRSLRISMRDMIASYLDRGIAEYLPEDFRLARNLMEIHEAISEMHFPSSYEMLEQAKRRIIFDEFLLFQITLLKKIERLRSKYRAFDLTSGPDLRERFAAGLPFQATASQCRAMAEIEKDVARAFPMNRLLMGDVGSGKTVVAAFAAFLAASSGRQAAVLVPTEILAQQHYETFKRLLAPFKTTVKLLTSNTAAAAREKMLAELRQGKIACIVGTHALLQDEVRFDSLALVVVDEQHKFGVYQRSKLLEGDPRPHQLVMTATPIPRTLALTVYGDLDVSVLRELPAGRQPVKTYWITRQKQPEVLRHILEELRRGGQAYFVFPAIEETEKSDLLAAKKEFERLRSGVFKSVTIGLVHGKMDPEERESVMKRFKGGEIRVLVATSVVEVGVDNPNATVMVIENAERFGLSQLHQLRGRIGRGNKASECFLFGEPPSEEGKRRLRILTKTQDGFVIAEEDLKLRGPGDFLGARQSGEPLFQTAHPVLHESILLEARECASRLVKSESLERDEKWNGLKTHLENFPINY